MRPKNNLMKTLEKIMRVLGLHKQELKDKYKIKEIEVFGSYVRKERRNLLSTE